MRMGAREEHEATSDIPGVVFVQLDGVPAPLLENEIRSGNIPTISRWVRSGSHTWTEWTARVPSTTPVSQAGLLHGNNHGIPAFRWFDRELGRLLVANRPEDAAIIEARVGNGRGLLADDGVSISNLFSGDAATSLLTMSGLKEGAKGLGPSQSYAAFFTHPAGILRAVILTVGEMVKEVFQARRQVRRGVEPRIHRGGAYVALRAVTNVFLRDLNVALVVEAMMKGSKSIYVDFVDYDEIAHHAGVTRTGVARRLLRARRRAAQHRAGHRPPASRRGRTTSCSSRTTGRARARRSCQRYGRLARGPHPRALRRRRDASRRRPARSRPGAR